MVISKGRRTTLSLALVVGATLTAAGIALNEKIREQYWLQQLEHGNEEAKKTAAAKLGMLRSTRAVPLLVQEFVNWTNRAGRQGKSLSILAVGPRLPWEKEPSPWDQLRWFEGRYSQGPRPYFNALLRIGPPAVQPTLGALVARESEDLADAVTAIWIGTAAVGEEAITLLRACLQQQNELLSLAAVEALFFLGARAEDAIPELIALLGAEYNPVNARVGSFVKARAITLLRELKPSPEDVIPRFIELLDHPHDWVRVSAATAIGEYGPAASSALVTLERLIEGPFYNVYFYEAVSAALKRIRTKASG